MSVTRFHRKASRGTATPMTRAWQQKTRLRQNVRSCIAMAAAYLFALQGILGGVALSHMAAAAGESGLQTVICYGSGQPAAGETAPEKAPVRQLACAVCTLAFASATVPPPALTAAIENPIVVALLPAVRTVDVPARRLTPKLAQGPPHRMSR